MNLIFLRLAVAGVLLAGLNAGTNAQAAPTSAEQLRATAETALGAKDTNAFKALFNHQGVSNLTNGFETHVVGDLCRFLRAFPTNTLHVAVRLGPIPEGMESENIMNGVRIRPNMAPLGMMSCRFSTLENGTNVSWGVTLPYGETNGQFGIIGTVSEKVYEPKHKENLYSVAITAGMGSAPVTFTGNCVYVQNGATITNNILGHHQVHKVYSGDALKACAVQTDAASDAPVTVQIYQAGYDGAAYTNSLIFSGYISATNHSVSFIPKP